MGRRARKQQNRAAAEMKVSVPNPHVVAETVVKAAASQLSESFDESRIVRATLAIELISDSVSNAIVNSIRNPEFRPACRKGCTWCCLIHVAVSAPEVLTIAAFIRKTFSDEQFSALMERIRSVDVVTRGLGPSIRPLIACPLLKDGACSIYQVRPLACRAFNSLDMDVCKRSYEDETNEEIPMLGPLFQSTMNVSAAFLTGLEMLDLKPGALELTAALTIALEDPDAGDKWVAGEPVFEPARMREMAPEGSLTYQLGTDYIAERETPR